MKRFVTKKVFRMIAISLTLMVCLFSASVVAANTYRKNAVYSDIDTTGSDIAAVQDMQTEIVRKDCGAEAAAKEAAAAAEKAAEEAKAKTAEAECEAPGTKPAEKPAVTTPAQTQKPAETTKKPAATTPATTTKPAETTQAPETGAYSVSAEEREVVRLVNEIRRSNGLSELTLNEALAWQESCRRIWRRITTSRTTVHTAHLRYDEALRHQLPREREHRQGTAERSGCG